MKRACQVVVGWIFLFVVGQSLPALAAERAAPAAPAKAEAKKPSHRLPNYFGDLGLEEGQRDKIYAVQDEYGPKIEALERQLETLRKERDAKVAAVLTPDQVKKLDDLKSASKAKRDTKKPAVKKSEKPADAPAKTK